MNKKTSSKLTSHKTSASNSKTSKAQPKAVQKKLTQEQIAVRAYFISMDRQQTGRKGDHFSDWIEAERELKREAK